MAAQVRQWRRSPSPSLLSPLYFGRAATSPASSPPFLFTASPNLVNLVLLSCEGAGLVKFELGRLERCRLDFLGQGNIALFLSAPRLEDLYVQGFSSIWVKPNHRIKTLSIAKNHGNFSTQIFGEILVRIYEMLDKIYVV